MPRYALDLEFSGGGFCGSQRQMALRTVQGAVEAALARLDGGPVLWRPCSRLDQGVSARSLPGDCPLGRNWRPVDLGRAVNSLLDHDLAVIRCAAVDDGWNARNEARSKTYAYRVLVRPVRAVLDPACHWVSRLDHPERLHQLSALIAGEHDLSGFSCLRGDGTDEGGRSGAYAGVGWVPEPLGSGTLWTFRISAGGFQYKQVRGLVGAMLCIAQGRASIELFQRIMDHGRGAPRCGNIAPGGGLTLEQVVFSPEPSWVGL